MKKIDILILGLGLAGLSAGMNSAMSQNNNETRQGSMRAPDAVSNAQTVRETSITRPEQKKSEHDRSNIFGAANAAPSSPAFDNQPDKGKILGFDFYRDPLNAKKPMQTFEEIMKADVADRAKVMKTQHELLLRRYDLTPRLDREATREVSNGLVLRDRELERLDAVGVGALAEKLRVRCILGNLLDALVDLAEERLVSCALRCMGIVRRHVSPPSVVEHSLRRESASDELAENGLRRGVGAKEGLPRRVVHSSADRIGVVGLGPSSRATTARRSLRGDRRPLSSAVGS